MVRRIGVLLVIVMVYLAAPPGTMDPFGPGLVWAEEGFDCRHCHTGGELSGLRPLDLAPSARSDLAYQPCPGLRLLFRERYLLESRLANLALVCTRLGYAEGQTGFPAANLGEVSEQYRALLAVPVTDDGVFAVAAAVLSSRLDREVYLPLVRRWRLSRLYLCGGVLLMAVTVLSVLVWRRFLPWRRCQRDQELFLKQAAGGASFNLLPDGSGDREEPRSVGGRVNSE